MDIVRTGQAQKRRRRNIILAAIGVVVIVLITMGLKGLKPAAPTVDRQTVWVDTVQRGEMVRNVRGPGTLVPEDIRWISSLVDGRVEKIPNLPGITVSADTVLIELSNPETEQNAAEAEQALKGARADLDNLRAQLDSSVLNQRSQVSQAVSAATQATLQAEADTQLAKDGLIPALNLKLSTLKRDQLVEQTKIEQAKFKQTETSARAQISAQQAKVQQAQQIYDLRKRQLDSLKVRAGISGVLQEVPVQVGQRLTAGNNLARVARPEKLKAQLKIPETQAKDVVIGQKADIDTRNGIAAGRVIRVAPSVQDGTVTVDVSLVGQLPQGARPDLSVDGTIEIEKLPNVVFVGRPAFGQAQSKVQMFKLVEAGKEAIRVPVQLGRSSTNTMEIVSGLKPGDQVILSDTSAQDGVDRIRLN
ncbi:MAG: HlyD family efflux transporter periplasmic adaptor subunit [Acidobacteriota bacterium]|nr:HlyD family efflux transporter periplasmic adaptor subunit [Acidobacteriota bacterium]